MKNGAGGISVISIGVSKASGGWRSSNQAEEISEICSINNSGKRTAAAAWRRRKSGGEKISAAKHRRHGGIAGGRKSVISKNVMLANMVGIEAWRSGIIVA
jgi:hypothetical protein